MDERIMTFIKNQNCFTFCTSQNNQPYCASCFYAYDQGGYFMILKSSQKTKHIMDAMANNNVAGAIVPNISKIGVIKGIQFTGKFVIPNQDILKKAQNTYYRKFPFAIPMPGELWIIELTTIKMTDNTLGFGKKLNWEKESR